ncbi:hypothetical protein ACI703_08005 [Isoptericola jiangsuensis]|uniref:hypothetical protein n=1 Tax=Isoptericola jiangsuensis TaxID=548579 RepID=UPI0038635A08
MSGIVVSVLQCSLLMGLLCAATPLSAKPKCEADTFTGKKSCVYGIGTIGLAGVGNQIITADGQMRLQRMMQVFGDPVDVDSLLFRVDDRRTLRVNASNNSRPQVNCSGRVCTWSWTIMIPMSRDVLEELAGAQSLIMAVQDKDGRRGDEMAMKKGGKMFREFLEDIQANEPEVLQSSKADAFVLVGTEFQPFTSRSTP